MSKVLETAARIAQKKTVRFYPTDIGEIYFVGMNGTERNEYFDSVTSASDKERLIANQKLIARQMCEEDGTRCNFEEALAIVLNWDIPTYVKPIVDEVLKASGLGDGAAEQAEKK